MASCSRRVSNDDIRRLWSLASFEKESGGELNLSTAPQVRSAAFEKTLAHLPLTCTSASTCNEPWIAYLGVFERVFSNICGVFSALIYRMARFQIDGQSLDGVKFTSSLGLLFNQDNFTKLKPDYGTVHT
jgi:hypothetical protein